MDEIAIFWDYENIKVVASGINVPLAESLIEYSKTVGHTRIKKVYCDWAGINKAIIQALYGLGFDPIQVSMGKANSVDVKIAVDCLETALLHPSINYFIIITGDKDFIPVVNWLKAYQKEVIIISRADIVSEHLLLSASDFVSIEELSKMYKARKFSKTIESRGKPISFEEAVNCLVDTVTKARDQGLSTRYELIANLMRSSPSFNYEGIVQKPDGTGNFSTFSKFIDAVEEAGKIKTDTVAGFKEIFLIEEDPQKESEFSQVLQEKIDKDRWAIIFDVVKKSFSEGKTEANQEYYGRFMYLLKLLRDAKKEDLLPYSHSRIKEALEKLVQIGYLTKNADGSYNLVEDHEKNYQKYLNKVMNELIQ